MPLEIKRPTKIERGKSCEIIEKVKEQNFTGIIRLSFKTDEISKSELIVENGIPVAMETKKMRTGKFLRGNEAFWDFINAENCVAEFYPLERREISSLSFGAESRVELDRILGVEVKEVELKEGEFAETAKVETRILSEFERKKIEIVKLLDSELGKIAEKYVRLVESTNSLGELLEVRTPIFSFLDSLATFLSKKKVQKVKSEFDRIVESLKRAETSQEKGKESDEFEEFRKELISRFERVIGSRELQKILEELEDWVDLIQKYPQIKIVASKFATLVPWNKVEELLRIIEEKIAEKTSTKLK